MDWMHSLLGAICLIAICVTAVGFLAMLAIGISIPIKPTDTGDDPEYNGADTLVGLSLVVTVLGLGTTFVCLIIISVVY